MKAIFFLAILISVNCNAQSDSVYIDFFTQNNSDCFSIHPADGMYKVTNIPTPKLKIPGFVYIDPVKLATDSILTTFSYRTRFEEIQPFQYSTNYYKILGHKDADTVVLTEYDTTYYYRQPYISDFNKIDLEKEFNLIRNVESEGAREYRLLMTKLVEIIAVEKKRIKDSIWRAENPNRYGYGWANGIIDGIWIRSPDPYDFYYHRVPFLEWNPEIKDSILNLHQSIRKEEIQPQIDEILSPYYLSKTEVTNKEYREFVNWVKDSIARELIFMGLEYDEKANDYINWVEVIYDTIDGEVEEIEYDQSDREINRKNFTLNWDKNFYYTDPALVPILASMYYPQPERFYKRREIDTRQFNFVNENGEKINVYPDTTEFHKIYKNEYSILEHIYFWHPYYNDYPVVNVSYKQVQAFCEWKQRKINSELKDKSIKIEISIPTLAQYEFGLKQTTPNTFENEVHDHLNSHFATYERKTDRFESFISNDIKLARKYDHWQITMKTKYNKSYSSNFNDELRFINSNVSEMVSDELTQRSLDHYGLQSFDPLNETHFGIGPNYSTGVKVLGDDSYNAIFYKSLMNKNKGNATTGFRLVYKIVHNL